MGTTPKPLVMVVLPPLDTWDEITTLAAQGHSIHTLTDVLDGRVHMAHVDVFLGPTCWRMDEAHRKYLPIAIAEARRARYPVVKKAKK